MIDPWDQEIEVGLSYRGEQFLSTVQEAKLLRARKTIEPAPRTSKRGRVHIVVKGTFANLADSLKLDTIKLDMEFKEEDWESGW